MEYKLPIALVAMWSLIKKSSQDAHNLVNRTSLLWARLEATVAILGSQDQRDPHKSEYRPRYSIGQ